MFTGIVEDVGHLDRREDQTAGQRLWIRTSLPVETFETGESIAIAGACMTVVSAAQGRFAVDVSAESLRRSTLGALAEGDPVNLERAMRLGDRLGGHMVSGHLDGTAVVDAIRPEGESRIYTFRVDASLMPMMPMIVEKGSVAVDGTSLTCFHCRDGLFDVAVIPHTLAVTTLGVRRPGDHVNIELDVMGKYVARLVDAAIAARVQDLMRSS